MSVPAPLPRNEAERLARLRDLAVLDTAPEPLFDRFARLAAQVAGAPIALVSLVDQHRQWFKASVGMPGVTETPRELAFCAHALLDSAVLEVPDTQQDPRFADNPLVTGAPGIRFYAGAPLELPGGERLGTLCVIDREPRRLTPAQREQLSGLAAAVTEALLLRERTLARALDAHGRYESELLGHVHALGAILDRLPAAVSVWDRELRNRYSNAPAQQRLGRDAEALRGAHLSELLGADALRAQLAYHEAVLAGEPQAYTVRDARAGRSARSRVQLLPIRDGGGAVEGFVTLEHELATLHETDAALRALAASEQKFRTLSDASPMGVFHTDAQGRCTYTNARWQAIYGLSAALGLGDGWAQTLHPEDRAAVIGQWQRCATSGQPFEMEFRVQRPDGTVRSVRSLARELRDDQGALTGFVGTVEDVTDARAAQARLRESEAFLDRTGRLAGVGGWEYDVLNSAVRWSDQTCRIHGVEPGHRPALDEALAYYAPEARAAVSEAVAQAIEQGTPFDLEQPMITAGGRRIWVRAVGEAVRVDGRTLRLTGAFQDITRRHEAEAALRHSNELLLQLYQQTPAMMQSIDPQGVLLSVSDLWLSKLGYTRDEVVGRRSFEFLTPASQAVRIREIEHLWRDGRVDHVPLQVIRRDGSLMDVLLSAIAQCDAVGRPLRALVVMEDVTEVLARTAELRREQVQRQQLERHARELDALLAERDEMLNVLAHEVRQPLNNASAALQSAAAALADPRQRAEAALGLQRAQGVMSTVLSGIDNTLTAAVLLGSTAPGALAQTDVDIDTMLAVAIGDMPPAERERVRIERVARTRTAAMDMGMMRLALRNLLANALRCSAPGTPVTLRVSDSDQPLALVIDVIDQGPGIQRELLPRLFERGTRGRDATGRASHGLGLYIVRRVLEVQGGRAELLATGAQGTTMRLWLAQERPLAATQSSDSGARNT